MSLPGHSTWTLHLVKYSYQQINSSEANPNRNGLVTTAVFKGTWMPDQLYIFDRIDLQAPTLVEPPLANPGSRPPSCTVSTTNYTCSEWGLNLGL